MTQVATSSGQVVTSQQALVYAASVGNDPNKIAAKANELGLNSQEGREFLAQTFGTDIATVRNYLDSNRYTRSGAGDAGGAAQTSVGVQDAQQAAVPINLANAQKVAVTPQEAPKVFDTLYGAGNASVNTEDIRAWFSVVSRSASDVVDAMVAHNVSAAQLGRALGLTAAQLNETLVAYGLDQQTLVALEVDQWSEEDFDQAVVDLSTKGNALGTNQTALTQRYNGIEPLMNEARAAQDMAAEKKAAYDALNTKFEPAFAEYTRLSQELSVLESSVQSELAQKATAQNTLANLGAIEVERDRRATAEREAQYQLANADQKITQAQPRIDAIRARMQEMEVWGKPLMDQTLAAKSEWEAAAKVANQKVEIAGAQGDLALQAADAYRASVTRLNAEHTKILSYLQTHPNLKGAQEVQESVRASMAILQEALESHREWTNAAVSRGEVLHQEALTLESATRVAGAKVDAVQPERLAAEAQVSRAQAEYNQAMAAEVQAQADLDAAYRQRHEANYAKGKGGRNRARDEANRLIEFHAAQLSAATQRRIEAQASLDLAKKEGQAAIDAALVAEAPWREAAALSSNARDQALFQMGIAGQLTDVEVATQSALATGYLQMVEVSRAKVASVKEMVRSGQASLSELVAVEKEVQADVQVSLAALRELEQVAASDRVAESNARKNFVQAQTQALGAQGISKDLLEDAASVQQVVQAVGLPTLQGNFDAAQARLKKAELGVKQADMYLDWAEGKVQPKKQGKAMARAHKALDAANEELAQARQAFEVARIQLQSAQQLTAPMSGLSAETGWAALSAVDREDMAISQASTVGLQAQVARSRFESSDATFAAAQAGLIEVTRALGQIQQQVAKAVSDPEAARLLESEAKRGLQWADDYSNQVADVRQAQERTRAEELKLDALTIDAGAQQLLGEALQGKADRVTQAYEQFKAKLSGLEAAVQAASQKSHADVAVAKGARDAMEALEKSVATDFALSRVEGKHVSAQRMRQPAIKALLSDVDPTGEKGFVAAFEAGDEHVVARAGITEEAIAARAGSLAQLENERIKSEAGSEFFDSWFAAQMKKRKTMRKQLHLLDDLEQFKGKSPELLAARDAAMQTAKVAEQSGQRAIDAGEALQAGIFMAALGGQWLQRTQVSASEAAAKAADLAAQVAAQAAKVKQFAGQEQGASDRLLSGLKDYVSDSGVSQSQLNAHAQSVSNAELADLLKDRAQQLGNVSAAYMPLIENVQVVSTAAQQTAADADSRAQLWNGLVTTWKQHATQEAADAESVKSLVQADAKTLGEKKDQVLAGLMDAYNVQGLVKAAILGYERKADYIKEIHADRLMADQVEKKRKKNQLFSTIMNIGAALIAAVVAPYLIGLMAPAAAGGAAAGAAAGAGGGVAAGAGAAGGGVAAGAGAAGGAAAAAGAGVSMGTEIAVYAATAAAIESAAQGISVAAGWQESFDPKMLAATASMAGFISIAGTVSQLIDEAFKGTVFARVVLKPGTGVGTIPAEFVDEGGKLAAVGGAVSWGTGAAVGGMARTAFNAATGLEPGFSWDSVMASIVQHGIGGAFTLGTGSGQWARQLYTSLPAANMRPDVIMLNLVRRAAGTTAQLAALDALDLRDGLTGLDVAGFVAAQFGQNVTSQVLGMFNKAWQANIAGQALIRTTNFVIQDLVFKGLTDDFELAFGRGLGRGIGQAGATWGYKNMSDFIKSFSSKSANGN